MKKLFPLGSVVNIKGNSSNLMIVARMVKNLNSDVYDYCACVLPKGIMDNDCLAFFNQDDVNNLLFIGFQNEEELKFNYALCLHVEKIKKEL